jgi:hypothetical protein
MSYPVCYTRRMIIETDMKMIMISPTNKASQRTKNRIREKGPVFQVEDDERMASQWLLRAAPPHKVGAEIWMGWLPRDEFHVECVSKEFIEKVLG